MAIRRVLVNGSARHHDGDRGGSATPMPNDQCSLHDPAPLLQGIRRPLVAA